GTNSNRPGVQERPAPLRRIVCRTGDEVPDEGLLNVRKPLVSDGKGDRVRRYPADGVVRSVDRIEDEDRLPSSVDEAGLFAQDVQRRTFVVEHPQDRFLRESVDARAGGAIRPSAHDFGGIPLKRFDRMLDGVREFEKESLHRPTYRLSSYRIMARRSLLWIVSLTQHEGARKQTVRRTPPALC